MNTIKALFFDIDGTLIPFGENTIDQKIIDAINEVKKKGYKVGIATSRPMTLIKAAKNIFDVEWDAFVAGSGTKLFDQDLNLYKDHSLDINLQKELFKIASDHNIAVYTCGEESYFTEMNEYAKWLKETYHVDSNTVHPFDGNSIQLLTLLGPNQDEIKDLYKSYKEIRFVVGGKYNLDIFPTNHNKKTGIHEFMKDWGFNPQDYMSFGDTQGDYEMLIDANVGIAMPNATEDTKEVADYVCQDIPEALKKYNIL